MSVRLNQIFKFCREQSKEAIQLSKKTARKIHDSIQKSSRDAPPSLQKSGVYLIGGALTLLIFSSTWKCANYKIEAMRREREIEAGPWIRTAQVEESPTIKQIHVIGEAKPFASVTLYAKVSGYLKEVNIDKGDIVTKGQILAIVESLEIDRNYDAALADAKNKRSIANRVKTLLGKNLVSQQEAEQAMSDADVAEARLNSQAVQKGYEMLRAPFSGTVTARYADPGALVQNATTAQTGALPVVTVSQVDKLRVYIYLDQKDASYVEVGAPVQIKAQEKPTLKLQGGVTRISGELDSRTRMLLTEIDLDNSKADLVPGSFVQVSLEIKVPAFLEIPVESVVLIDDKPFAPVMAKDETIHFKAIEVLDNDGKKVRILSGLEKGETVGLNVGHSVSEGGKVRPIQEKTAPGKK